MNVDQKIPKSIQDHNARFVNLNLGILSFCSSIVQCLLTPPIFSDIDSGQSLPFILDYKALSITLYGVLVL